MESIEINTLRNVEDKPALFSKKGGELQISGPSLVELLRAVLDKGVPFRFRAKGFSMNPFIKDGDVITIFPLQGSRPRLGDVVAFTHPSTGGIAVHRVVGKKGSYFSIRGDNLPGGNETVSYKNLLGFVRNLERNGKNVFFGLGPERRLIALSSRSSILPYLLSPIWRLIRPFFKR